MEFRDNIFEKLNTLGETSTWVLLSQNALLTNYAIDTLKEQEKGKSRLQKSLAAVPTSLMSTPITDIDTETVAEETGLAVCTLEEVWKRPGKNISGRWWCVANYDTMSKKDRANLFNYIKNPCQTVLLVVTVSDFRNIAEFKKSRAFTSNRLCHLVNIQYPSKTWLLKLTKKLFLEQNIRLNEEQLNTFLMKMGTAYDEYRNCIDTVTFNLKTLCTITEDKTVEVNDADFKAATKNIEHFNVDDLLRYMLVPLKSTNPLNGRRAVHKALARLLETATPKELCNKLNIEYVTCLRIEQLLIMA